MQFQYDLNTFLCPLMHTAWSQWSSGKTLDCVVLGPKIKAHCGLVFTTTITVIYSLWHRVVHPYCSA